MGCALRAPGRRGVTVGRHSAVCFLFVLIGLLSLNLKPNFPIHRPGQPAAAAPVSRLDATYGKLPLSFEANLGQTDRAVKFLSRGRGCCRSKRLAGSRPPPWHYPLLAGTASACSSETVAQPQIR